MAAAALETLGARSGRQEEWLRLVGEGANPDGTFGRGDGVARETGSRAVTVLRLGGRLDRRERIRKAIRDGQRPDGGFGKENAPGSDLESTYRVMRAFMMLGEDPKSAARCRAFVDRCRNADGGYGVAPGQVSTAAGSYFAASILHWLHKG